MPMVNGKMMSPQEYLQLIQEHLNPSQPKPMQANDSEASPGMDENAMQKAQLMQQASSQGEDQVGGQLDPNYYNPDGSEKKPPFQKLKGAMGQ